MVQLLTQDMPAIHAHRGWRRFQVDADRWRSIAAALRDGTLELLGEWGDTAAVHCALHEPGAPTVWLASVPAGDGGVPSLAALHAPAVRLERAIADLFGTEFLGLPDPRPWLDHGRWPVRAPLSARARARRPGASYEFLPAIGPSLHQLAVGPVHAGIIEPGHFRFSASGETIVRLEARLGYVHRGVEQLFEGRGLDAAAAIAARVSGDSTVAYSLAFARAAECALELPVPGRAQWLRAIMAELERIANHLGDIGAICNDAGFAMMHAECGILREHTLRACAQAFGHRLMMDRIVPGGVATDLRAAGREALSALLELLGARFPELIELYDSTASLQDRTSGSGVVREALAAEFAAGGFVGRASGRAFDVRVTLPYAPYEELPVKMVLRREGDVDARVWVRILEVQESVRWLQAALAAVPEGATAERVRGANARDCEATALVEGFRGDILAYLRLGPDLQVQRCYLRDPSWFQWPLLEAAIDGNIVADFPLCNKSFNCSYAGHDL